MKSHPAGLRRPTNIVACSWEGASQLRWCEVGLGALGWVEKARVSRPGSKGRRGPLGGRRRRKGLPYGCSPEGCEEMDEGLV